MTPERPPRLPDWSETLTKVLDDGLRVPGTRIRFGLDAIIGALLPGAGDALTALGSASLLILALKRRVPSVVLLRMLLNIAIDALVGALPILGDIFDVAFKANRKNLELIERSTQAPTAPARPVDYVIVGSALAVVVASVLLPVLMWMLLLSVLGQVSG